jgi:predicted amino acid racemase
MPFLSRTITENPDLIRTAVELHQAGSIPANTLLLDLDVFAANAALLKDEAERLGLRLYFMTKQHGRNPVVFGAAVEDGRASTVCVDIQCAKALHYNGLPIGHVGNLAQIPQGDLRAVIGDMRPEVMSVFSLAKVEAASAVAVGLSRTQDLLLRVCDEEDVVFPGMAGGFRLDRLEDVVRAIKTLPSVRIAGVTTFPAIAYTNAHEPEPTPNLLTLLRAAERLSGLGVDIQQINAPGNTSFSTLAFFAEAGVTHVEPGSALSGHTTYNLTGVSPERPGAVYVTEVSHFVNGSAWVYGGGFFIDDPPVPQLRGFAAKRRALVGHDTDDILERGFAFLGTGNAERGGFGGLDYHGIVDASPSSVRVGDTAVFGFRTQAFVTRAHIAVVEGASTGHPKMRGLYDAQGHELNAARRW